MQTRQVKVGKVVALNNKYLEQKKFYDQKLKNGGVSEQDEKRLEEVFRPLMTAILEFMEGGGDIEDLRELRI